MVGRSGLALALAAGVLLATPAHAEPPPPVGAITVTSGVERATNSSGETFTYVKVSWASEDPSVESVYVCLDRGVHPAQPGSCDIVRDVLAPKLHTDRIPLHPRLSYAISVFAQRGGEYSQPVTATQRGTTVRGKRAYYATYGDRVTLRTTVTDTLTDEPVAHRHVQLWQSPTQRRFSWSKVGGATTDADGTVEQTLTMKRKTTFAWVVDETDGSLASYAISWAYVAYRLTARLTDTSVDSGDRVRMYGVVRPKTPDKRVTLLEYTTEPCTGYMTTSIRTRAKVQRLPSGRRTFGYVLRVPTDSPGTTKYEALASRDRHVNGGASPPVELTVAAAHDARAAAAPAC